MIDWLTQLICMADLVFLLVLFFTEKNNPSNILLWALVLVFLPFLGFILYSFDKCYKAVLFENFYHVAEDVVHPVIVKRFIKKCLIKFNGLERTIHNPFK